MRVLLRASLAFALLFGPGCDALDDGAFIPGEVVVALEPGTPEATLYRYADPRGLRVLGIYEPVEPFIPAFTPSPPLALLRVPVGREDRWAGRLSRQPFVRYAERNQRVHPR